MREAMIVWKSEVTCGTAPSPARSAISMIGMMRSRRRGVSSLAMSRFRRGIQE